MTDFVVSPDKDFIHSASASGGVWKSTDDGDPIDKYTIIFKGYLSAHQRMAVKPGGASGMLVKKGIKLLKGVSFLPIYLYEYICSLSALTFSSTM